MMLPNHTMTSRTDFVAAKYADSGLDEMIDTLVLEGAHRKRLVAKIAGAAHMIKCDLIPGEQGHLLAKSKRSGGEACRTQNSAACIGCGEDFPRTVVFEPGSGAFGFSRRARRRR